MSEPGALRLDAAALRLDQLLHERESDSEAAADLRVRTIDLLEHLEHAFQHVCPQADAGVSHSNQREVALAFQRDADLSRAGGELGSVVQEIRDDLYNPHGICGDDEIFARQAESQLVRGQLDRRSTCLHREGYRRRQRHASYLEVDQATAESRHVEQVVDQAHHLRHLTFHQFASSTDDGSIVRCEALDLQRVADRCQGVAKFVRQRRHEFIFQPAGVRQFIIEAPIAFLAGTQNLLRARAFHRRARTGCSFLDEADLVRRPVVNLVVVDEQHGHQAPLFEHGHVDE